MLEELVALAKLAEIDAQALSAETQLSELPTRMAELDTDVKRLGELLESERQELAEADSLLEAQDAEIQGASQSLARSKAKSARARNMREADAVERELEVIRRTMRDREAERESLKEAIEKRRASVEKHEKEFAELQGYAAEERAKVDAKLAELTAERDSVLGGRDELAAKIPKQIMRRYELIRSKRGGVAAVTVLGETCSGCYMQLAPNQLIAILRGETFEQCPRCQRMLVSPKALDAKEPSGDDEE